MSREFLDEAALDASLDREWDRLRRELPSARAANRISPWPAAAIAVGVVAVLVGAVGGWHLVTVTGVATALLTLLVGEPD